MYVKCKFETFLFLSFYKQLQVFLDILLTILFQSNEKNICKVSRTNKSVVSKINR